MRYYKIAKLRFESLIEYSILSAIDISLVDFLKTSIFLPFSTDSTEAGFLIGAILSAAQTKAVIIVPNFSILLGKQKNNH